MFKKIIFIGLGIVILVFSFYWFNNKDTSNNPVQLISQEPFYELTIPYLREKSYESKLGDLNQVA